MTRALALALVVAASAACGDSAQTPNVERAPELAQTSHAQRSRPSCDVQWLCGDVWLGFSVDADELGRIDVDTHAPASGCRRLSLRCYTSQQD